MIAIVKQEPPEVLIERQKQAKEKKLNSHDSYALLSGVDKKIILKRLLEEQGGLCAYCMRKLPDERVPEKDRNDVQPVTIEHIFPRNPQGGEERGQGLDYANMVAVCSGNVRKRQKATNEHPQKQRNTKGQLTCGAKKKESLLRIVNPCKPASLTTIKYKHNGTIYSENPDVNYDLNITLGLNCSTCVEPLPEARKKVRVEIEKEVQDLCSDETNFETCCSLLEFYKRQTNPKTPYVGVIIWFLEDYIQSKIS